LNLFETRMKRTCELTSDDESDTSKKVKHNNFNNDFDFLKISKLYKTIHKQFENKTAVYEEVVNEFSYDGEQIPLTLQIKTIPDLIQLAVTLSSDIVYCINRPALVRLVSPLTKLNKMVGLQSIKEQILNLIMYHLQHISKTTVDMFHTVIVGPPGVGKSMFAEILCEIYVALGVLKYNKIIKASREDLIADVLGKTTYLLKDKINEASGGVLFIDEAYSLASADTKHDIYAKECIDVLNKYLSEKRDFICVIAGYEDQLNNTFFAYNPGMKRRFPFKYNIDSYTSLELYKMYVNKLEEANIKVSPSCSSLFIKYHNYMENFGGDVETLILYSKMIVGVKSFGKRCHIFLIDEFSLQEAFDKLIKQRTKQNTSYTEMYL